MRKPLGTFPVSTRFWLLFLVSPSTLKVQICTLTTWHDYWKLMLTQTPVDWAKTFPYEKINGTISHTHIVKTNGYKNWITQHLVPRTTSRQVNWVQLQDERKKNFTLLYSVYWFAQSISWMQRKNRNKNEHNASVRIHSSVQTNGCDHNPWIELEFHVTTLRVPIRSRGQSKQKLENWEKHPANVIKTDGLYEQLEKRQWNKSNENWTWRLDGGVNFWGQNKMNYFSMLLYMILINNCCKIFFATIG